MFMKTVLRYVVLSGLVVLLAYGCSTVGKPKGEKSVAVTADTLTTIRRGATFSLSEREFADAQNYGSANLDNRLVALVIDELSRKGLRHNKYAETSALLLNYTVDLGANEKNRKIEISPSNESAADRLAAADNFIEHGLLMLELTDNTTGKTIWRNRVVGFTDAAMPDAIRIERLLKLVEILVEDIPVSAD
jgi:hypothetical protein